ncbi:MAG: TetR family transcriptional regulator [Solirubrobacterales bacterium]|nr:TetR family transcriptional regulator [Solirubrobacterales bacterium]
MSSKGEQAAEAVRTLPRGRHKLSREDVRASQRARLVGAMLEQVGARGYEATRVSDVVAAARVSRNAFYEQFEDRQDCLIAACDEVATELLDSFYALADAPTWTDAVARGLDLYLESWARRPGFTVAYLVELPTAGRRAIAQRDRAYERFERMFEVVAARARVEQPGLPPLPRLAPRILVTAITELLAAEARAGRAGELRSLRDELLSFIVSTLADDVTAAALARKSTGSASAC